MSVLEVTKESGVVIVRFSVESVVDEGIAQRIGNSLMELIKPGCRIIIDLSIVRAVSDVMLGKFITLDKRVKAQSGKLTFCGVLPELREIFALSHLDTLLNLKENKQKALEGMI